MKIALLLMFCISIFACSSVRTYEFDEIKPDIPVNIGNEVRVLEKGEREAVEMIVTAIDQHTISGQTLEQPSRIQEIRWSDISLIRVETPPDKVDREWSSNWLAFGAYLVIGATVTQQVLDLDD